MYKMNLSQRFISGIVLVMVLLLSSQGIFAQQRIETATWYHNGQIDVVDTKVYSEEGLLVTSVATRNGYIVDGAIYIRSTDRTASYRLSGELISITSTLGRDTTTFYYFGNSEPTSKLIETRISDAILRFTSIRLPENRIDEIYELEIIDGTQYRNFINPATMEIVSTSEVVPPSLKYEYQRITDEDGRVIKEQVFKNSAMIYDKIIAYAVE